MKRFILAIAATAVLCVGFSAPTWAVTIQATLDSFDSRTATIRRADNSLIGSGGGIGSFTIVNPPAATGDPLLDDLFTNGNQFLAYCLEPDETISSRSTYSFEIVDLRDAPTSSEAGPMGLTGETWIEKILSYTAYNSIDELASSASASMQTAFQAALYEAGYEDPTAGLFDFGSGDARVASGAIPGDHATVTSRANSFVGGSVLDQINAYGLLNVAQVGSGSRTAYTGQDFMVFTRTIDTVPVPMPLALIGLGLAGLGWTRARR